MKFYDRKAELSMLSEITLASERNARMTLIVGRRRIGKTRLILKALEDKKFLYFFVSRKDEKLLCEEFLENIKNTLQIPIFGTITNFKDIFELLMNYAQQNHLNLVIDEFQEFSSINPSIYSELQNIWDKYKENSKINLIISGSVFSLMTKIFENTKEPLFGRATDRIKLTNFDVNTLKLILKENYPSYTNKDLLTFYIFTGGIAKYVEYFVDRGVLTFETMIDEIFKPNSYFIDEGKNLLIEEFGREYKTYFSILSLIASSKTSRTDIESILERNVGGYLEKLENEYNILKKNKPILAKPLSKNVKYFINDNFLNFWFRFIYKNQSSIEIENFNLVKELVKRDFNTFSGFFLEKYFTEKLILSEKFSQIGNYWEKRNMNEIDIIAINEIEKIICFYEVKLNKENISISKLAEKSKNILANFPEYQVSYEALSLEEM